MWEMNFVHPWAPHALSFLRANTVLPVMVGGFLGVYVGEWALGRGEVISGEGDLGGPGQVPEYQTCQIPYV